MVHVFDVLAAGSQALLPQPWTKRQEVLARLLKHVRPALARVQPHVVHTEAALRAAIDAARQAPGSTGAVLKMTGARYQPVMVQRERDSVEGWDSTSNQPRRKDAGVRRPAVEA